MRIRFLASSIPALALVALFTACGGEGDELPACPEGGSTLTYDNFGRDFMVNYCVSCHTATSGVAGAQDVPLDSQSAIQAEIDEIFHQAGGANADMPPEGNLAPSAAEREQLSEWLSCGAK